MTWVDPRRWDPALSERFRSARPFAHVVIDDLLSQDAHAELLAAFPEEPASRIRDEIFDVMASAPALEHPAFRRFQDELGTPAVRAALEEITGKTLRRVEARAYAYLEGHYLLPHADHQEAIGRAVAFAYYVACPDLEGGELELFACELADGAIAKTEPAGRIPPRANRLVLFDVSDTSLHQVREVTRGARLSVAGWFYP